MFPRTLAMQILLEHITSNGIEVSSRSTDYMTRYCLFVPLIDYDKCSGLMGRY